MAEAPVRPPQPLHFRDREQAVSNYDQHRGSVAASSRHKLDQALSAGPGMPDITRQVATSIARDVFAYRPEGEGRFVPTGHTPIDEAGHVNFAPIDEFLKREGTVSEPEIADAEQALDFATTVGLYKWGKWPNQTGRLIDVVERQRAFYSRFPERARPPFVEETYTVIQQAADICGVEPYPLRGAYREDVSRALEIAKELNPTPEDRQPEEKTE